MSIRAVVFDMDGVLIDARDWHYEALNRALSQLGQSISRFDHLVTYDGLPTRAKLEMLSRERNLPRSLHSFLNELKQVYTMELVWQRCKPRFQHQYALSQLHQRGLLLGCASNSVRATIEAMLGRAELLRYFDVVLSNEDVAAGKPHPEIYLKAASVLNCVPREVLVIEDNDKGVAAARSAGCNVLQVAGPDDVHLEAVLAELTLLESMAA